MAVLLRRKVMIMEKKDEKVRQLVMLASMADEAMIFNDPKKEMYQDIHKCLEKRGYEVMCIDLRNSQYSDKWNPLGAMINKYKKLEKEFTEYSRIASKGFVHTLESHKGFVHTNRLRDVYIQSENVLYTHFIF